MNRPHDFVLVRAPLRVDWHYACRHCGLRMSAANNDNRACPRGEPETTQIELTYPE